MAGTVNGLEAEFVAMACAHWTSQGLGSQCTPEQLIEINAAFDRELRRRAEGAHAPISPNRADRGIR